MTKHILFILFLLRMPCTFSHDHTIFSPGFMEQKLSSERQVQRYKKNNIIQGAYTTCTYNDNREKANFGQEEDIATLNAHYQGCCNGKQKPRIVLTGLSRGAAALFTFLASKKPTNIAAIIAESPFACLEDVIEHKSKAWKLNWVPGIKHIMGALATLVYPAYKQNGIKPITSIENHPQNIPVVIACSKQDTIVPYTSSVQLAKKLRQLGYEVYLLIFQKGHHGFLSYKEELQQIVNALYARHNLPHNQELAQQGARKLETYKLE